MIEIQKIFSDLLLYTEGFSAVISLLYYKSVKNNFWKFFAFYLIIIFLCEVLGKWWTNWNIISKAEYYNYLVIPLQFIFLYWLYAVKSMERKTLFFFLSILYLVSFVPSELYFKGSKIIFSFNYTFGSLLMMILVVMEYYKQITSSDIIYFYRNKMFFINLGVTLFYIGTLPFWTFYYPLIEYTEIWNSYFIYFLVSGIIMYLLFSASFIWGKQNF
jgi:hypothetical protein